MDDIPAFDRAGSVRFHDADTGRLHVRETAISKAGVNQYYGREIPRCAALGLDPNRRYSMLRPPEELEKAAKRFDGVPLMAGHPPTPFKAAAHKTHKQQVCGTVGTEGRYEHPYLKNSIAIWDGDDIEKVAMDSVRELSSCYHYDPDMTPGTYEGVSYDGRMTNIRGHHVALVPLGRAGRDVLVADSGEDILSQNQIGSSNAPVTTHVVKPEVVAMDAVAVQAAVDAALAPIKAEAAALKAELAAADQRQAEAVTAAKDEAIQHMRDLAQAEKDVAPLVGPVAGMDSAEAIYDYALKQKNIDADSINLAGKRAMVKMAAEKANAPPPRQAAAMDSAQRDGYEKRFAAPFLVKQ